MPVVIIAIVLLILLAVVLTVYKEKREKQQAFDVVRSKLARIQEERHEREILAQAATVAREIKIGDVEEDIKNKAVDKIVDGHFNPQEPEKTETHD